MMTFASLDDAYERASWASGRILRPDVTGRDLTEAVRVHRLASTYIVKAEKLALSGNGKIADTSIITTEHRRKAYANSLKTRRGPNQTMMRLYLQAVADNGGKMTMTELFRTVDVSAHVEKPNRKNLYRRMKEAESAGYVVYASVRGGNDRNGSTVELTTAGRDWLQES